VADPGDRGSPRGAFQYNASGPRFEGVGGWGVVSIDIGGGGPASSLRRMERPRAASSGSW
jgi:hypothetical protein